MEYPQSGERFRGIANSAPNSRIIPISDRVRRCSRRSSAARRYALTPTYTLVTVDGSGDRGTAINRVMYPDGTRWYALNLYELRDGKIAHSRHSSRQNSSLPNGGRHSERRRGPPQFATDELSRAPPTIPAWISSPISSA